MRRILVAVFALGLFAPIALAQGEAPPFYEKATFGIDRVHLAGTLVGFGEYLPEELQFAIYVPRQKTSGIHLSCIVRGAGAPYLRDAPLGAFVVIQGHHTDYYDEDFGWTKLIVADRIYWVEQ